MFDHQQVWREIFRGEATKSIEKARGRSNEPKSIPRIIALTMTDTPILP
jgi:hypothetical protein